MYIDEQSASMYILQLPPGISNIQSACECVNNSLEVSPEEIKLIDQQTVDQSLSDKSSIYKWSNILRGFDLYLVHILTKIQGYGV
jgi:hypothetical protein